MKNRTITCFFAQISAFLYFTCHPFLVFAQPKNDNCQNPIVLRDVVSWYSGSGEFTNKAATASINDKASCFMDKGNDVWFAFTAIALEVTISVCGAITNANTGMLQFPEIALYNDDCGGSLRQLQCVADTSDSQIVQLDHSGLVLGANYLMRVQGRNKGTGTFSLYVNNYNPTAPSTSDCIAASVLCDKSSFVIKKITDAGNDRTEANGSCLHTDPILSGENNSTWHTWTCEKTGTLTFSLSPLNPTDDLDFILFELPNGIHNCKDKKIVRCMASGDNTYPSKCMGATGLKDGETDITEPPGCKDANQSNFLKPLDMEKGKSYALMVNNFSGTGNGFDIKFGGTGEFLCPKAGFTVSDKEIGKAQAVTVTDASVFTRGEVKNWRWSFGQDATPATATGEGPHRVIYTSLGQKTLALSLENSLGGITTQTNTLLVKEGIATAANDLSRQTIQATLLHNTRTDLLQVQITSETPENIQLQIIDSQGKTWHSQQAQLSFGENQVNITTNQLANGLYFLKMNNAQQQQKVFKFVKN